MDGINNLKKKSKNKQDLREARESEARQARVRGAASYKWKADRYPAYGFQKCPGCDNSVYREITYDHDRSPELCRECKEALRIAARRKDKYNWLE